MEKIVYLLVSKGGGVDGRDFNDKGGVISDASFSKEKLTKSPRAPWCDVKPVVVDEEEIRRQALAKLSPLDKLILGLT